MADVSLNVPQPSQPHYPNRTAKNLLPYYDEVGMFDRVCRVCGDVPHEDKKTLALRPGPINCPHCGMWEVKEIASFLYQRICVVEIEVRMWGDSKRKQNARIKHRDKAIAEARELWKRRNDPNCVVFQFGELDRDDWLALQPMIDWFQENDFPVMAESIKAIAEARRLKQTIPSLIVPELKFTLPKGAKG